MRPLKISFFVPFAKTCIYDGHFDDSVHIPIASSGYDWHSLPGGVKISYLQMLTKSKNETNHYVFCFILSRSIQLIKLVYNFCLHLSQSKNKVIFFSFVVHFCQYNTQNTYITNHSLRQF